ncbi:MAG TPA: GGDEF domain-containing protein [Gemmata sp.]
MNEPEPAGDTELAAKKKTTADARPACLVHIAPSGPQLGNRYFLGPRAVHIGRVEDCDIRTAEHSVSRRHARIEPAEGGHAVRDLGSTNGTAVNNTPIKEGTHPLKDGDYLQVGNVIYRYLAGGNIEAEYHEEIYRLAIQDGLTRLPNRRALDEFLEREVGRSRRHARPLSVLLLDLDRFKAVNDVHGHLCGDTVLRALADRLRAGVRVEDLCARYGGEEFAVVLVETDHATATEIAERLRAAVAAHPFRFENEELALTVSIGVATTWGDTANTPSELLRVADSRLYQAKRGGRNRVTGNPPAAETVLVCGLDQGT